MDERYCKNCKWYYDCKGKYVCEEYDEEKGDFDEKAAKKEYRKEWEIYIENWDKV